MNESRAHQLSLCWAKPMAITAPAKQRDYSAFRFEVHRAKTHLPKIKSWENRRESGAVFSFHRAARVCEREKGSKWKIGEEFYPPQKKEEKFFRMEKWKKWNSVRKANHNNPEFAWKHKLKNFLNDSHPWKLIRSPSSVRNSHLICALFFLRGSSSRRKTFSFIFLWMRVAKRKEKRGGKIHNFVLLCCFLPSSRIFSYLFCYFLTAEKS